MSEPFPPEEHAISFVIRPAQSSDAESLALTHVVAWQRGYAGLLPDSLLASLSVAQRAESWRSRLAADPPALTLVAAPGPVPLAETASENGPENGPGPHPVLGFASIGESRDEDAGPEMGELLAIYVHPDSWRAGVGSALHAGAVNALRERGFARATLWVLADNVRARGFYARLGWRPDGSEKQYVGDGFDVPEVRLALDLSG